MKRWQVAALAAAVALAGLLAWVRTPPPLPARPPVTLQPLGAVGADALAIAQDELRRDGAITLAPGAPAPASAWCPARRRYDATALLASLPVPPAGWWVAITEVNADTRDLTDVYGLADRATRRAVIFVDRLRQPPAGAGFDHRLRATLRHELGHLHSLAHCPTPRCAMHYSASLADTDRKGPAYCRACAPTNRP